ncbi:sensor histidine kinase [Corynebacterium freiburgense]|uniref:sensor histidine kinase n=1 Tax=Corynebacterium freiburgense TaxID=556548 RepID=UPI0004075C5E|nr:sensor histidine kinase [Corynebacterium freiburgense]WJZ03900.1 Sensor histidine kinase LiaS [Corynebacterium freiburgense]
MNSESSAPGNHGLRQGIHILTAMLLVVIVIASVRLPTNESLTMISLSCLYGAVYFIGNRHLKEPLAQQLWLLALTCIWVIMVPIQTSAVYLVFALYFLYLQILDDIRGLIAVIGATIVSVVSQYPHITIGSVLGPCVAAMVSVGINYAFQALWTVSQERQELIDELLQTRTQLAETERAAGIAAERQRIAHEIHDTLAQGLSSIQMLLHVAERDLEKIPDDAAQSAVRRIQQARTTAADNLGEARAMIAALQPAALSKTSLEGALHRVAQSVVGTEISVVVEGEERQLPMRTEASLLRIAQGAVGNVGKHAHADRCRITLTYGDEEIRLDIVDDGIGFDPASIGARPAGLGHIGLDAMRQRAYEQGGSLSVESEPGGGTAVSVALPVPTELESKVTYTNKGA